MHRAVLGLDESDLATRVKMLSKGTREASANLLFGGACGLAVSAVGGLLAMSAGRRRV